MYEKYLIQTHGFRNVCEGNKVVGFEVGIRIAYYRGVPLTIINALRLTVDGETFEGERLRFSVGGRSYTMAELAHEERDRWEFDQTAMLLGLKPGGLKPGPHLLRLQQTIKPAYITGAGFVSAAEKTLTLLPLAQEPAPATGVRLGVSLYSYQEEYYTRAMTLEDCVAEVAAIGAKGVQLIGEQMMHGYPFPSSAWVDHWHFLMHKYGVQPTLMDTMVDMDCGGHRQLTIDEGVEHLVQQMKLAKLLGFTMIRPTTGPVSDAAPDLIRAALPHAEKLDVCIAPEIHAPITLTGPYVDSYLELIAKTGSRHAGFTLDLGIFCKCLPPAVLAYAARHGAQPRVIDYVDQAFRASEPHAKVTAEVARMSAGEADLWLALRYRAYGPPSNKPEGLRDIIGHVLNVHGKFYEITDGGEEESIPYEPVLAALAASGYAGFIDSEYEGQRLTQDAYATDSCEQVRRHHMLMRRCLASA